MSAETLAGKIEHALSPLVGLPLTDVWRPETHDILIVEFGDQVPFINQMGQEATHGMFALHITCPWRIVGPSRILFGYSDLWKSAPAERPECTMHDYLVKRFLATYVRANRMLHVESIWRNDLGDITLFLTNDCELDIITAGAKSDEFWRLVPIHDSSPHFVITPDGVEHPAQDLDSERSRLSE